MALLLFPQREVRFQPAGTRMELDWSHPLARELRSLVICSPDNQPLNDLTRSRKPPTTLPTWTSRQFGWTTSAWAFATADTDDLNFTTGQWSVACRGYIPAAVANARILYTWSRRLFAAAKGGWALGVTNAANIHKYYFETIAAGASNQLLSAAAIPTIPHSYSIGGSTDGTTKRLWINGKQDGSTVTAPSADTNTTTGLENNRSSADAAYNDLYVGYAWARELRDVEWEWLHEEPYAMLLPVTRRWYSVPEGAPTLTLEPTGITSAEAFGTAALRVTVDAAGGMASGEAFGSAQLQLRLATAGIASAEAVGTPQLVFLVAPASIASAEAVGTPQLLSILRPTGLVSAETFGSAQLNLRLLADALASAEAFGAALVSQATIVAPASIASTEAFGTAQLNLRILAAGLASAETFGTARLRVNLLPAAIPTAEALGTPALFPLLQPPGIPSAEAFGTGQLNQLLRAAGLTSTEAFGAHRLALFLTPTSIGSAEAVGTPGAVHALAPAGVVSLEAFGAAQLNQLLRALGLSSAEAFGTARLISGLIVLGPYFAVAGQVFVPGATAGQVFIPGAEAGEISTPGAKAGEIT